MVSAMAWMRLVITNIKSIDSSTLMKSVCAPNKQINVKPKPSQAST